MHTVIRNPQIGVELIPACFCAISFPRPELPSLFDAPHDGSVAGAYADVRGRNARYEYRQLRRTGQRAESTARPALSPVTPTGCDQLCARAVEREGTW